MFSRKRTIYALLPVILLIYEILAVGYFEKIPVHEGFGWDGMIYAQLAWNLTDRLDKKEIGDYYFKRIVPLIVSHCYLSCFAKEITPQSVIFSFQLMNLILLFFASVIWLKIARILEFSFMNTLLSFSGLFVNYAVLKMSTYYPVLMDYFALSWCIFMLYLYLIKHDILLLTFTIVGAFIFPSLFICGSLLYMFPYNRPFEAKRGDSKFAQLAHAIQRLLMKRFNMLFFSIIACGFLGSFGYVFFHLGKRLKGGANNPDPNLKLLVSAVCLLLFLYAIVRSMDFHLMLNKLKNELVIRRCLIVLALYFLINVTVATRSYPDSRPTYEIFMRLLYESLTNPLVFILSHILYFGPSIILIIVYWKKFMEFLKTQNLGIICIIYLFLFTGIGSESRCFIVGLPFFVYVLYQALRSLEFNYHFIIIFLTTSILFSKVWFHINKFPFTGEYTQFPLQRYFMTQGPWMSDQMYYLQGAAAILVLAVFYMCSRKRLLRFR